MQHYVAWLFAVMLLVSPVALSGVAVAQESTPTEETPQDESERAQNEDSAEPYEFVFSDSLRLVESEWRGKTFVAVFEADITQDVIITDAGRELHGNENVVIDEQEMTISRQGTTEVKFTVEEGRAVTIKGGGVLLGKGYSQELNAFPDGNYTTSALVLTGFVMLLLMGAFGFVLWSAARYTVKRVV